MASSSLQIDFYHITMAYALWSDRRHEEHSIFDVFFRKCPFGGEFVVLAGIHDAVNMIQNFKFCEEQIQYFREKFPNINSEFFDYLKALDTSTVKVYAIQDGTFVFPREPLIRVEGHLGVCQLLETPLLNCLNFPSLIATNAARLRLAAGWDKILLEFGARRAQGPNGALCASKYAFMGGFDYTSNCKAGQMFQIPISGTQSHTFICSFTGSKLYSEYIPDHAVAFHKRVWHYMEEVNKLWPSDLNIAPNKNELAAFISYSLTFPDNFLCLVDTYDTLSSGIPNFVCVSLALLEKGHTPIGIRIDSGDLAYLSRKAYEIFTAIAEKYGDVFRELRIAASNDINEDVIKALNEQEHNINALGIGTNIVTCQSQPSLGMVYKLTQINKHACVKLSEEFEKITIPGRKTIYRFFSQHGKPIGDLIEGADVPTPKVNNKILCRHLFDRSKRCFFIPSTVKNLLNLVLSEGCIVEKLNTLQESRDNCISQLKLFRPDHLRLKNPTPFKVCVTPKFHESYLKVIDENTVIHTIQ